MKKISIFSVDCSQWFDRDNPSGTGDWELAGLSLIPTSAIECKSYMIQVKENSNPGNFVMTNSAQVFAMTGNKATFRFPTSGFYGAGFLCTNRPSSANPALPSNQRQRCKDFSVRFCCWNDESNHHNWKMTISFNWQVPLIFEKSNTNLPSETPKECYEYYYERSWIYSLKILR